jgi:hypothetical protein
VERVTEREFIEALCAVRPAWSARRSAIHAEALYYVDGAALGRELFRAALRGSRETWISAAFEVLEWALRDGTDETRNLVVAGFVEVMQNEAYQHPDSSAAEMLLGPSSRKAWSDLIESWTGGGVRTMDAWRRVVLNGLQERVTYRAEDLELVADLAGRDLSWRSGRSSGHRVLTDDDAQRIEAPLRPLVARRWLRERPLRFEATVTSIEVDGPRGRALIEVGGEGPGGRFAQIVSPERKRWFVIDMRALERAWAFVMPPRARR